MAWNPEEEPEVYCMCTECGCEIYFGEEYYNIPYPNRAGYTLPYCKDCIDNAREEAYFEPYEPDPCDLAKERYYESLEEER